MTLTTTAPKLTVTSTAIPMDAGDLCDFCEAPWIEDTPLGRLCRRDYGWYELAGVILHPEMVTKSWTYRRGAKLRRSVA